MKNERNPRARSKYAGIDTGQLVIVRDTDGGEDPLAIVYSLVSLLLLIIAVFGFKDFILDANNIPSGSMIPTLKIGDYLFVNKMRYSIRAPFTGLELARLDEPERGDIITFIPPHERERHFVKRVMGLPGDRIRIREVPACSLAEVVSAELLDDSQREFACASGADHGPEPYVAVVEYRPGGEGPWLHYPLREVPAREARSMLLDADNPGVLHRDFFPPLWRGDAGLPVVFEETVGDHVHYMVETYQKAIQYGINPLCPTLSTEGCVIPEGNYLVMGDNRDDSKDSRAIGYISRERILGKALVIYFSINWHDKICSHYVSRSYDRDPNVGFLLPGFSPEDQAEYFTSDDQDDVILSENPGQIFSYLHRTLLYRIPRMAVRWSRPGTILR